MSIEFVIEQNQRVVVEENADHIQELFNVQTLIANGTAGKVWITLKGAKDEREKAKVGTSFNSNR